MRALALLLLLPLATFGCKKSDQPSEAEADADTDADADSDTDADTDTDSDADTDSGDSGGGGSGGSGGSGGGGSGGSGGGTGGLNCVDDNLEDNDSPANPTTGVTNASGLESIDNDDDWFEIDVPAGAIVEVEIFFIDAQGDIDLRLEDAGGGFLASSTSVSDGEFVTFTNNTGAATTWYANVYMFTNNGCNTYDIEIRVGTLGPEICDDLFDNDEDGGADCDDYECLGEPACLQACPNEDSYETNDDLGDATTGFTSDTDLMVHPQNEDWFEIVVDHDELATVTLSHDPTLGRVDAFLVDATGATLDSDTSSDPDKIVQAVNTSGATQTWYARVHAAGSCNNYDLALSAGPIPDEDCGDTFDNDLDGFVDCDDYDCLTDPGCTNSCPPEDAFEDNDNIAQAATGASNETGLMVHRQDEDFFELVVGAGEIGRVDLTFVHADGDIDLQLLDVDGNVVDASGSTSNAESVLVVNDGPNTETFYARVFVWSGSASDCNTYAMNLYTGPIPDEDCADGIDNDLDALSDCNDYDCIDDAACIAICGAGEDASEDNDDLATAAPIGAGPYTIHALDDDWFVVDVPDGEQVIIDMTHDHLVAVLDIRLYDAAGVQVDSDLSSASDTKQVSTVNSTGTATQYFLEVTHWNGQPCNTYTLATSVAPVPDEACDDTTDNDLDTYADCDDYDCLGDAACVGVCPDEDVYGGINADPAIALPLASATGLSTHVQRPDWFRITVGSDELATVDVTFTHADGNLKLEIYDEDLVLLQTVDTATDDESALVLNETPASADYFVKVSTSGAATICNSFDFAYTSGPLPDEVCDDTVDNDLDTFTDCADYECGTTFAACNCPTEDLYEPNDTPPTATPGLFAETGLAVFRQRSDFFAYTVPAGSTIDITVTLVNADGDIDFYLRDDLGTGIDFGDYLIRAFTSGNIETGTWTNTGTDPVDVVLETRLWAGNLTSHCNDYDLAVTITP
ncbi:MAG: pre-peptidase C-terminal domain-containing protein [Alphaproteobacteria bacterium]|nr:pre-peptidase C-terminal domain-containing protein [Alphaproteobacteria bacterium]